MHNYFWFLLTGPTRTEQFEGVLEADWSYWFRISLSVDFWLVWKVNGDSPSPAPTYTVLPHSTLQMTTYKWLTDSVYSRKLREVGWDKDLLRPNEPYSNHFYKTVLPHYYYNNNTITTECSKGIKRPSGLTHEAKDSVQCMLGSSARKAAWFKEALSINVLRACVYIYNRQLSSFRVPTLWFIGLTVATCHIQYTCLSLGQLFLRENGQNTKILKVRLLVWRKHRRTKH